MFPFELWWYWRQNITILSWILVNQSVCLLQWDLIIWLRISLATSERIWELAPHASSLLGWSILIRVSHLLFSNLLVIDVRFLGWRCIHILFKLSWLVFLIDRWLSNTGWAFFVSKFLDLYIFFWCEIIVWTRGIGFTFLVWSYFVNKMLRIFSTWIINWVWNCHWVNWLVQ